MTANLDYAFSKITSFFFAVFLVSLPLTNVLFINLGFPLKIQEISFLILTVLLLIGSNRSAFILLNRKYLKFFAALAFLTILSFLKGFIDAQSLPQATSALARISPMVDSLLKAFYVILSFFVFCVSRYFLIKDESLIKYFFWGAWIAAMPPIFFFICGLTDVNATDYFKWSSQIITMGHAKFIRNGTFLEGNFLGLYLLIALIFATEHRRFVLTNILAIATVSTFSTPAILGVFIYCMICIARKVPMLPTFFSFLAAISLANHKSNGKLVEEQFIQKLPVVKLVINNDYSEVTESEKNLPSQTNAVKITPIQTTALSATERAEMIRVGKQIFLANPLLGVGPANYKFHFHQYTHSETRSVSRAFTANNIFIEILCEYGIIFFLIISAFFLRLVNNAYKENKMIMLSGVFPILVYFLSYPSFSVFFLWVFWAALSLKNGEAVT